MVDCCPTCGRSLKPRLKRGEAEKRVMDFLLSKGRPTILTTSWEIGRRTGLNASTVADVLRRLERDETIFWTRGHPGNGRGSIMFRTVAGFEQIGAPLNRALAKFAAYKPLAREAS